MKRLRTDWIDFHLVHSLHERTPIELTLPALHDLRHQAAFVRPTTPSFAAPYAADVLKAFTARR